MAPHPSHPRRRRRRTKDGAVAWGWNAPLPSIPIAAISRHASILVPLFLFPLVLLVVSVAMLATSRARSAMGGAGGEEEVATYGPICVAAPIRRASSSSSSSSSISHGRVIIPGCDDGGDDSGGGGGGGGGDRTVRKMIDSPSTYPVYFIHIGMAGGSSVDDLMTEIFKCANRSYVGRRHYDWSYVRQREGLRRGGDIDTIDGKIMADDEYGEYDDDFDVTSRADVIMYLRHPASRAASQFEFSKTLPWARRSNASFLSQTFDEYLDDGERSWNQPLSDGESGTDFLAGIFPSDDIDGRGGWVLTDGRETRAKARLRSNRTASALLAARRLEGTAWFGLLEDVPRSMELLGATLGLGYVPILPVTNNWDGIATFVRGGMGGRNDEVGPSLPSVETTNKIAGYVPGDLWLYEYATRLFDARYEYLVVGDGRCPYIPPVLPPLPDFR